MPRFCGNCGVELVEGQRYCANCGKEISSNIDVGTNSSTNVSKPKGNYNTYKMVIGIIMIIICFCLISAGMQSYEDGALLTFTIPGVLGMIAGIMTICSRSNHNLLKPAGIIFLVSAGVNFFGIIDISIYAILAIVFGILNINYSKKNDNVN